MNTKTRKTRPPTELQLERALDVIRRAARAKKESGELDPIEQDLQARRAEREKQKALAAACEETGTALYRRLIDSLPAELKDLLDQYGMMVVSPYAITTDNYEIFQRFHQDARQSLALQEC